MTKASKVIRFPNGETYRFDAYWQDAVDAGRAQLLTGKEAAIALREYQRERLLQVIKPKTTLKVVCTHHRDTVSHFRVFVPALADNGKPYIRELTREIAEFAGFRVSSVGDIVMSGYGCSKSFQIGYSLGHALWPAGTPEPHGVRNGEPDSCGGYAIGVN